MKTARFTLETPDRVVARSLLHDWSERAELTIVRGRVSPDLSRYDLEIRGEAREVARILREAAPAPLDLTLSPSSLG